jgi:hypothetical protein
MRVRNFIRRFIFGDYGPPPPPDAAQQPGDVGMKKIIKDLFECALVVNLVTYFGSLIIMLYVSPGHYENVPRSNAIGLAGLFLLLLFSVICLFASPRKAGVGFLVLLGELFVSALFPEL